MKIKCYNICKLIDIILGGDFLKDTEIIYEILSRVLGERNKVKILRKLEKLERKKDEEKERILGLIKSVMEMKEL